MNVRALSLGLAALAAAAAGAAADDRVLVLSTPAQLLHASSPPTAAFSSAGLAELAMDALGLGSGSAQAAQSPLQADVFRRVRAYALVSMQDDGALLEAVEAGAALPPAAFHARFPLTAPAGVAQRTPDAIAGELLGAKAGSVQCAGSAALCAARNLRAGAAPPANALVQRVLAANRFLHEGVAEDVAFARELAQVQQLTAQLRAGDDATLYVVGFSDVQSLDSSKRSDARAALAAQVAEFLSALQKTHAVAGAQVVATRTRDPSAAQLKQLARLDAETSYARLLAALAPEPSGSADDDDEDDESDDSGSGDEEAGSTNATRSSSNATSAEKVTLEQIAEYQIVLWTSVLLAATLLLVVLAMCNMNTGRDSLLYAKFITDAGHRKGD